MQHKYLGRDFAPSPDLMFSCSEREESCLANVHNRSQPYAAMDMTAVSQRVLLCFASLARACQAWMEGRERLGELLQLSYGLHVTLSIPVLYICHIFFVCCALRCAWSHSCMQKCSLEVQRKDWNIFFFFFFVGVNQTTWLGNLFLLKNSSWTHFDTLAFCN